MKWRLINNNDGNDIIDFIAADNVADAALTGLDGLGWALSKVDDTDDEGDDTQ